MLDLKRSHVRSDPPLVAVCRAVLCRARPPIRGSGTTGEARETGAPLTVGGEAAAEERGLAKNNASLRRTEIHTCVCTDTGTDRMGEDDRGM